MLLRHRSLLRFLFVPKYTAFAGLKFYPFAAKGPRHFFELNLKKSAGPRTKNPLAIFSGSGSQSPRRVYGYDFLLKRTFSPASLPLGNNRDRVCA
jgi:hypothetical protein